MFVRPLHGFGYHTGALQTLEFPRQPRVLDVLDSCSHDPADVVVKEWGEEVMRLDQFVPHECMLFVDPKVVVTDDGERGKEEVRCFDLS